MPKQFLMPKLGLTMESGTILSWLVADGEEVTEGQAVLVIETDKVESDVEASGSGRLSLAGVVGETYDCGEPIGWFLADGEDPPGGTTGDGAVVSAPGASAPSAASSTQNEARPAAAALAGSATAAVGVGGRLLASPNAKRIAAARGIDLWTLTGSGPGGRIVSEDVEAAPATRSVAAAPALAPAARVGSTRATATVATVAARQLADLLGIDLRAVSASSSTDPRVTRADVAAHVRSLLVDRSAVETSGPAPLADTAVLQVPTETVPLRGMRGTIAQRMHQSLQEMAQLTLTMDVDMDAVVADRDTRKRSGSAPGFTDYVIAAAAAALREHPFVNSQITEDGVSYLPEINVGLAVALDGGLIVPVVKATDQLDLDVLASETTRLADAARSGSLTLDELEGGTFSVTALGMFGVDGFTPVINPPNTAILGVGRLRDDVAWGDDGSPVRIKRLTLSLTWDHRAFDGAPAAEFTQSIKRHLEAVGS